MFLKSHPEIPSTVTARGALSLCGITSVKPERNPQGSGPRVYPHPYSKSRGPIFLTEACGRMIHEVLCEDR
ncbi:MAG: hypothetical protein ACRD2O_09990, partial [Terriglobia bacterium]